ncbi:MAG: hypothetical protein ACOX1T_09520 [Saccharofermentanales bacterium]|jgi:hypothetical protein
MSDKHFAFFVILLLIVLLVPAFLRITGSTVQARYVLNCHTGFTVHVAAAKADD